MNDWSKRSCKPCDGGVEPLAKDVVDRHLAKQDGWALVDGAIEKTYGFKNYYETVSFVNAAAWIAHREDHHPDITFGYKTCTVRYATHAAKGLTDNDFICAAKTDALLAQEQAGT